MTATDTFLPDLALTLFKSKCRLSERPSELFNRHAQHTSQQSETTVGPDGVWPSGLTKIQSAPSAGIDVNVATVKVRIMSGTNLSDPNW